MRIEHWSIEPSNNSLYLAPELRGIVLRGKVYGHPKFEDGEGIVTSSISHTKDGFVVTKSGSEYELGDVNPNYEAAYPNAKERLLSTVPSKLH